MKIIRVITSILLLACMLFTFTFGYKKIPQKDISDGQSYKGIISVWQIDSFDGGVGSRRQFLMGVAREIEKQNSGVLYMVVDHTLESANMAIKNGNLPDVVSYGVGLDIQQATKLNIEDIYGGGKIDNKTYAVSWCRGGYCIIKNPLLTNNDKILYDITVGYGKSNIPLLSYMLNANQNENTSKLKIAYLSNQDAFSLFVNGKSKALLGTQRDVYKLANRDMQIEFCALDGFNDLFQYISILTNEEDKKIYCDLFVQKLLSQSVQKKLHKIGMLSCVTNVDYDNEYMAQLQEITKFKTFSAFCGSSMLNVVRGYSDQAFNGKSDSLIKIKNMLI